MFLAYMSTVASQVACKHGVDVLWDFTRASIKRYTKSRYILGLVIGMFLWKILQKLKTNEQVYDNRVKLN